MHTRFLIMYTANLTILLLQQEAVQAKIKGGVTQAFEEVCPCWCWLDERERANSESLIQLAISSLGSFYLIKVTSKESEFCFCVLTKKHIQKLVKIST